MIVREALETISAVHMDFCRIVPTHPAPKEKESFLPIFSHFLRKTLSALGMDIHKGYFDFGYFDNDIGQTLFFNGILMDIITMD